MSWTRGIVALVAVGGVAAVVANTQSGEGPQYLGDFPSIFEESATAQAPPAPAAPVPQHPTVDVPYSAPQQRGAPAAPTSRLGAPAGAGSGSGPYVAGGPGPDTTTGAQPGLGSPFDGLMPGTPGFLDLLQSLPPLPDLATCVGTIVRANGDVVSCVTGRIVGHVDLPVPTVPAVPTVPVTGG
jgi:hypothetical protein